jgi:uncharacterized protein YndB with AHSA1/START domain
MSVAEQDPIERQVFVPAHPETVFKFLVEPELIGTWLGRALFATAEEGGLFCLQFVFGDGHTAAGVFTEVSPPHRVAFSFGWEGSDAYPPGASLVEIELYPQTSGTLLRLKHSGFPNATDPEFKSSQHGAKWTKYLSRLADTV